MTESCPNDAGVKIALGVITLLLSVSEILGLTRKLPVNGILDGVVSWGKQKFAKQPAPDTPDQQQISAALDRAETVIRDIV